MEKICPYPPCRKVFETERNSQIYCCAKHQQNARQMRYREAHPNLNPKKQGRPPLSDFQKAKNRLKREIKRAFQADFNVIQILRYVKEVHEEVLIDRDLSDS